IVIDDGVGITHGEELAVFGECQRRASTLALHFHAMGKLPGASSPQTFMPLHRSPQPLTRPTENDTAPAAPSRVDELFAMAVPDLHTLIITRAGGDPFAVRSDGDVLGVRLVRLLIQLESLPALGIQDGELPGR